MLPLPSWLRHCHCLVLPLPSYGNHPNHGSGAVQPVPFADIVAAVQISIGCEGIAEKILAVNPILEAFGNGTTTRSESCPLPPLLPVRLPQLLVRLVERGYRGVDASHPPLVRTGWLLPV